MLLSIPLLAMDYSCVDVTHESDIDEITIVQLIDDNYTVHLYKYSGEVLEIENVKKSKGKRKYVKFWGPTFMAAFTYPTSDAGYRAAIKIKNHRMSRVNWFCKRRTAE